MQKTLRINFELDQADNPPLYDELAKFTKGTKRVNRLRTLAHAGLLAQQSDSTISALAGAKEPANINDSAHSAATLELFGPSIN